MPLLFSSCVGIFAQKRTYDGSIASPSARVQGAEVRLRVKPEGTDSGSYAVSAMVVSAAVATLDGPFRWRVEATGENGVHRSMIVHRLHTRSEKSKRDEWYPVSHLGRRVEFSAIREEPGKCRARYDIPGLLKAKPREDGVLEILADVSIESTRGRERKLLKFRLSPAEKRQDEMIFLPAEIVKSFGKDPANWDDAGWD